MDLTYLKEEGYNLELLGTFLSTIKEQLKNLSRYLHLYMMMSLLTGLNELSRTGRNIRCYIWL